MPMPTSHSSAMPAGYCLMDSDDFTGSSLNPKWTAGRAWGTGNAGMTSTWANFTYDPSNITIANSLCRIRGLNTSGGYSGTWTGAAITQGNFNTGIFHLWTYGFFEALIQCPSDAGLYIDYWLMNDLGGPTSYQEFDIAEYYYNYNHNDIFQSVHFPNYSDGQNSHPYSIGVDLSQGYHLYQCLWTASGVTYYIDNIQQVNIVSPNPGSTPMFLIFMLDVLGSGDFSGGTTSSTTSPVYTYMDYHRVWQSVASAPTSFTLAGTGSGNTGTQAQMAIFFNGTTSGSTPVTLSSSGGGTFSGTNVSGSTLTVPSSSQMANFYYTPSAPGTSTISATVSGQSTIGSPVTYTASGAALLHGSAAILLAH
jgi:beta-glucanase (GH16 family)